MSVSHQTLGVAGNHHLSEGFPFSEEKRFDFTSWLSDKDSDCNAGDEGRCRFDPWLGKIPWRRKWQCTLVSLPRKSHGQRSLVGYSPKGLKESDTTEGLSTYVHTHTTFQKRQESPCSGGPRGSMALSTRIADF